MQIADAEHEESAPDASTLVISRLACSLVGAAQAVILSPGSRVAQIYGQTVVTEDFACNFGLNPIFRGRLTNGDLQAVGIDADGDLRCVELRSHPFFLATLFLPQIRSFPGQPHPLIAAFLAAAVNIN